METCICVDYPTWLFLVMSCFSTNFSFSDAGQEEYVCKHGCYNVFVWPTNILPSFQPGSLKILCSYIIAMTAVHFGLFWMC